MKIEEVGSSRPASEVKGTDMRGRIRPHSGVSSIPSSKSLRWAPCGIQELPTFQRLARRSPLDFHSRWLWTRRCDSLKDARQSHQGIHRNDSILPGIAFRTRFAHANPLASSLLNQFRQRKRAKKTPEAAEITSLVFFAELIAKDSVSHVSALRSRGFTQRAIPPIRKSLTGSRRLRSGSRR
jgi:hypothetical protein